MAAEQPNVMPGAERVVYRTVMGGQFGLRRPSRADEAEIWRRFIAKVNSTGLLTEAELHARLDADDLLWDARFEVLLVPRRNRRGDLVRMGERAPAHWLEEIQDGAGKVIGHAISFEHVDPEEWRAVVSAFEDVFKKKETSSSPNSTGSAEP